jgi:hypothetical protein
MRSPGPGGLTFSESPAGVAQLAERPSCKQVSELPVAWVSCQDGRKAWHTFGTRFRSPPTAPGPVIALAGLRPLGPRRSPGSAPEAAVTLAAAAEPSYRSGSSPASPVFLAKISSESCASPDAPGRAGHIPRLAREPMGEAPYSNAAASRWPRLGSFSEDRAGGYLFA